MQPTKSKVRVKVPATSANLGSGFDCAGIAYDLYNVFEFEKIDKGLEYIGCEKRFANEDNLVYIAFKAVCDKIGVDSSVRITIVETNIPFARGLGSSATLICAGAYGANKMYGDALSLEDVFEICTKIEGHPDNVAPALFGSLCASVVEDGKPKTIKFSVSDKIHFTILVPEFEVSTTRARDALPDIIDRDDAVYNMSRVALLPYAFERADFELLKIVTEDKLHQKYRKKLFKNIDDIEKACLESGAVSFTVSGAGSTCLAISSEPVEDKINEKIKDMPNGWIAKELKISVNGTREV